MQLEAFQPVKSPSLRRITSALIAIPWVLAKFGLTYDKHIAASATKRHRLHYTELRAFDGQFIEPRELGGM